MKTEAKKKITVRPFKRNSEELPYIEKLYNASFPDSERKPFEMVLSGVDHGKMEAWSFFCENQPCALAFVILGEKMLVLDYLAVDPEMQSHGIGAQILSWLDSNYQMPVIVEIESTRSQDEQAMRRKNFYLRNGMYTSPDEIELFNVDMELLSTRKIILFDEYFEVMRGYFTPELLKHVVRKRL